MCQLVCLQVFWYCVASCLQSNMQLVELYQYQWHSFIGNGYYTLYHRFWRGNYYSSCITLLIRVRPDLIYAYERSDENTTKVSFYGLFIILILLLSLITPFASSSPDGLESVAEEFGFTQTDGVVLLLDDYGISAVNNDFISTVLSALLGVTVLAIMFNLII